MANVAADFPKDAFVELHPATDRWMRGDKFGTVVGHTPAGNVRIKLKASGKTLIFHPDNVLKGFPGFRQNQD